MLNQLRFSSVLLMLLKYFFSMHVCAVTLNTKFNVINNSSNNSLIVLSFTGVSVDDFYFLDCTKQFVLDISYLFSSLCFKKFPNNFFCGKLIYGFCVDRSIYQKWVCFILNLGLLFYVVDFVYSEQIRGVDILLITTRQLSVSFTEVLSKDKRYTLSSYYVGFLNVKKNKSPCITYMGENSLQDNISAIDQKNMFFPIVVAIDAGHGGHDPGAKGRGGLYEKNVTIAISKKFKKLLDQDPMFSPVMIRDGDNFISISDRSKLARNKGAKVLLSIHADATSKNSKKNVRGSSVWVLSDRGANIEMAHWLKNSSKYIQSSGINNIFLNTNDNFDQYFHRAILDLQFSHSQRVGYEIALHVLRELKNIGTLHKCVPEYSNFAILRSLDIPSILVETGFITNADEEKLLSNDFYQEKIAYALYKGLRSYFLEYICCFENMKNEKLYSNFRNFSKYLYKNRQCTMY